GPQQHESIRIYPGQGRSNPAVQGTASSQFLTGEKWSRSPFFRGRQRMLKLRKYFALTLIVVAAAYSVASFAGQQRGAGGGRGGAPVTPRGLTVTGEVKNFVPVTDAMLR